MQALPVSALMHLGDMTVLQVGEKAFCWMYKNGLAKRVELQTGVMGDPDPKTDERWIEVTNYRSASSEAAIAGDEAWTPFDGTEQVILGDLSILADDSPVTVAPASNATKVASGAPDPGAKKINPR